MTNSRSSSRKHGRLPAPPIGIAWVLIGICSPLLSGCGAKSKLDGADAPIAVEAALVAAPQAETTLAGVGVLERRREMALSFRIAGVLTMLHVEAGDAVKAGERLAAIDATAVEAGQQQALAALERARRNFERDSALFARGFVSRQRIDDGQSELKAARAAYDAAHFDRRWASLISPVSGVVLERRAQNGEVVSPGQVIARVADLSSPLVLRMPLPTRDAMNISVGQVAEVAVEDWGQGSFSGRVTRIGEAADTRTGTILVEIELSKPAPALRSGQIARATLRIQSAPGPNGFARIPAEAVLEANGTRAFVYRVANGKANRNAVTFGGFDGDDALIAGLPPGARVITAGAGFVSDGEAVRIVSPPGSPR